MPRPITFVFQGWRPRALALLALLAAPVPAVSAGQWQASGALVDLSVEVGGVTAPLHRARDGSGRYYVEARAGWDYALRVANRTGERVAVLLSVDGLNVITGEREPGPSAARRRGRMYVLDPWGDVWVRGWRTSLDDVRRFTFVDEKVSYAARTGQANARMGWIEAWVFRERRRPRVSRGPEPWDRPSSTERDAGGSAPAPEEAAPPAAGGSRDAGRAEGTLRGGDRPQSFPGTGWGEHAYDPATLVDFVAEARPSDAITVRYEYAPALRALGILPGPWPPDRLRERDRGEGFARPPAW